jgi:hypothetical protein
MKSGDTIEDIKRGARRSQMPRMELNILRLLDLWILLYATKLTPTMLKT